MRFSIPAWPLGVIAIGLGLYLGGYYAISNGVLLSTRIPDAKPKELPAVAVASTLVPNAPVAAIVQMSPYAYLPQTVTVRRGEVIEFRNAGTATQRPMSDPHPDHGGNPDLNAEGIVEPGTSWFATMNQVGTFTYHDEVYPSVVATIIVN